MTQPPRIVLTVDGTEMVGQVVLRPGEGEFYGDLPEAWVDTIIPDDPREITLSFKAYIDYGISASSDRPRLHLRWRNA